MAAGQKKSHWFSPSWNQLGQPVVVLCLILAIPTAERLLPENRLGAKPAPLSKTDGDSDIVGENEELFTSVAPCHSRRSNRKRTHRSRSLLPARLTAHSQKNSPPSACFFSPFFSENKFAKRHGTGVPLRC